MNVAQLSELFLMNMGYARNDAADPDVLEEYAGQLRRWLNEAYIRAVRRIGGKKALQHLDVLVSDDDEPTKLDESLHPYLADYAAARGQELRGNMAAAGGLYAAFERALSECVQADMASGWDGRRSWQSL